MNGHYKQYTLLSHDTAQIWKCLCTAKEDNHIHTFTGCETTYSGYKKSLYSSPDAKYSSSYSPTDLLILDSLSINFILTSSGPWHTGSEKCLYTRSSLSLPSTDSLQCTLKRGFWLLNISLSFAGLHPTYCHDTP